MDQSFSDSVQPNPYERGFLPTPPPRSRRTGCWILGVIAFFMGMMILCCGGAGLLGYVGLGTMTNEIEAKLKTNPVLQKHVGTVESIELKFRDSMETDEDVWVYSVQGSEGSGTLIVDHITADSGLEEIRSAKLVLSDGREFDLFPAGELPEK